MENSGKGLLMVAGAGLCWATSGIFSTFLFEKNLSPMEVASTRVALAVFIFLAILLVKDPAGLYVNIRRLFLLALGGLIGVAIFNVFYMQAIYWIGVSMTVVLLYTSPVFAVLLSRLFLGEPLTGKKLVSLFLAFVGVVLVARAFDLTFTTGNAPGILFGLGAGFTFACLSVFGRHLTGNSNSLTAAFYLIFWGALFLSFIHPPWALLASDLCGSVLFYLVAMVIISTFLSHYLYISGLSYLEAGKASIAVAIEPVAAAFMAFLILGERLYPAQYAGFTLVLSAVLLLSINKFNSHT